MKALIKHYWGWLISKKNGIHYESVPNLGLHIKVISNSGGVRLGRNVSLSDYTYLLNVTRDAVIQFNNDIRVAHHFQISCANSVIIESHVNMGPFVFISDHNHAFEDIKLPIKDQGIRVGKSDRVVIGEGTWIGTKVTIIGNVRIGRHCVIGANSVVTKDIPDYSVAVGMPCKVIKCYDFERGEWFRV